MFQKFPNWELPYSDTFKVFTLRYISIMQQGNDDQISISEIPRRVRTLLASLVKSFTENNNERRDERAAQYRRTFFLTQFNIIHKESILNIPLTDIRVPVYSWPLINLPSRKLRSNHYTKCTD